MLRRLPWFALFFVLGCASSRGFEGIVEHPAELPVRAFAPIVIVHAEDADSLALATSLAEHLAADGTAVRLHPAGTMGTAGLTSGILVYLTVRFSARAETRWGTRPENVCGPYGCYVRQVSYPYDVVSFAADGTVDVREAGSGRALAARVSHAEDQGVDSTTNRALLMRRIEQEIRGWFDPREEPVPVRLPRFHDDRLSRVRQLAHDGRWDEAAAILRAFHDDASFAARPIDERADVLEALAITTRFATATRRDPVRGLASVLAFCDEATRLEDTSARRALREAVQAQLDEARVLEVQRGGSPSDAASALPVPDGYR